MNSQKDNLDKLKAESNQNEDLNWMAAEKRISDAMSMYGSLPVNPGSAKKRNKLFELQGRLEKGERTRKLYTEIMELTGG